MSDVFVFDERFTEAIIHDELPRVMGVKLRPFSYWHKVQLEFVQSKVLLGDPKLWDLWVAAKICSTQYPNNAKFKEKYSSWWWFFWCVRFFWKRKNKEQNSIIKYLNDYASPPKLWAGKGSSEAKLALAYNSLGEITGDAECYREANRWQNEADLAKGKGRDIDDSIEQVSIFMKYSGGSASEAWNMPMGELLWYNVCFLKMEGSEVPIWSPIDQAHFDAHTKVRGGKISELAKEIQAQSPGISLEIAIAKATVDYWGDVIAKQREVC